MSFTSFITEGGGGGVSDTHSHSSDTVDTQSHPCRQALPSLAAARGQESNQDQIATVPGNLSPHIEATDAVTATVSLWSVPHHGLGKQGR